AIVASISGLYLSYFLNLPSGPGIVLVVSGLFILALLFSPSQGIFTNPQSVAGDFSWRQELGRLKRTLPF
ncbi:MAG TPA: metal ABC transporter permease, partial [Candidatus Caenarcaniphilales bacterium]